jgi:hypothetical protein
LAKRGARREDGGGAPAEGSGPGGARPSPRPGFAMQAAAAGSSAPIGFWRGEAGPTAGGIPRVGGAAAGGGGLWKAGNGRMGRAACDRLIPGDPRLLPHGHTAGLGQKIIIGVLAYYSAE